MDVQVALLNTNDEEMDVVRGSPDTEFHIHEPTHYGNYPSAEYGKEDRERLRMLYPYVDQEKTPLPRYWSAQDKSSWLVLSNDFLHVTYSGQGKNPKDAAAVRADHPIPVTCGVFYFEVLVLSNETDCCMGVGLCEKNVELNRLPGWDKCSYGYHGDDGNFFCSSGSGTPYGPTFSSNDIVGCGINLVTKSIFYTKNGTNLGTAIRDIPNVVDLYPMIGLQKHGEIMETNFGLRPFKYNIEQDMQEALAFTYESIHRVELPQAKTEWMNNAISAWLAHEGYSRALAAFTKATEQKHLDGDCCDNKRKESPESMENRRALQKLVLDGKIGEAINRIETLYPTLLTQNKELALLLKCQQFVEMLAELTDKKNIACTPHHGTPFDAGISHNETQSLPKSARLSVPFSGIESSAQVFTQTGRSFTITSSGAVIGAGGTMNPFKRRSGQEPPFHQGRRLSMRNPQGGSASGQSSHAASLRSPAANGNSFMHVDDEPMDGESSLPGASGISASNGTSHAANGNSLCSRNGSTAEANGSSCAHPSATTIVAEELDDSVEEFMQEEPPPSEQFRSSGYSKAELAPYEPMKSVIEFGRTVNALSMEMAHPPQQLIKRMHDAFALICHNSPRQSEMGYLMDPVMREKAATAMNSAILEFLGFPAQSLLARHFRKAREMRHELALSQVGTAVFADVDKMVMGEKVVHR